MTTPEGSQTPPAAPDGQQPAPTAPAAPESPPWGDDFDPEKAWKLIQGLRADKERLSSRPVLDAEAQRKLDEFDQIKKASQSDLERAQETANRWQSETERWRDAAVGSTVRALAAPDFADPDDAVRNIDPASYLDAGGTIDEARIRSDLAALLDAKPHYRRADGSAPAPRTPRPNPSQGSGVGGKPAADPAHEFAAILQSQLK